jgi:hypothetical protein
MTSDATRPLGEKTPASGPTGQEIEARAEPQAYGPRAAAKFVGRVSQLDAEAVRVAVEMWRQVMRSESDAWFAAERAAAHAVLASSRSPEQKVLVGTLAECVLSRVWYRGGSGNPPKTPERRVGATEASGQYVATVAMLAILVRDHLAATDFALLYRPFATVIPLDGLGHE